VRGIRSGEYSVRVTDGRGDELTRDFVTVTESGAPVAVRLSSLPQTQDDSQSGTVSIKRLAHKVPKEAKKLFSKAMDRASDGDSIGAISLLQKAVQIDPEYTEALNNLAARYMIVGDIERAIPHLEKAIAINPHEGRLYSNLALALLNTGKPVEAETAARQALKLDPSDRRSRYMLGMSLFNQRKLTEETLTNLRQTQDVYPRGQLALAAAEAAMGDTATAKSTLQGYLAANHQNQPNLRKIAEKMLAEIEAAETGAAETVAAK
jgi:Flp pilus assembly protein TadD